MRTPSVETVTPPLRRNSLSYEELLDRITDRTATVAVVGLGTVGLPLARRVAETGFKVLGIDVDPAKIEALAADGRLEATGDFRRLAEADVTLVCVPTPLSRNREPDLRAVHCAAQAIADNLGPGKFVVLESTTFPGTTGEHVRPILEKTGLASRDDFFLAYSPIREDPGHDDRVTGRIPKVIGADGPEAMELARAFYGQVAPDVVPVSSMQVAEAVKLTENIYRAVNIGLVNELKVIFAAMGIDIWEVIDAAATKPFGFQAFYPGPGLGGHCIPVDPFYLTWKAREFGLSTRFIELAGEINNSMPRYVVDRLAWAMDQLAGRGLKGARVLVLGAAYKQNVGDVRESPALRILTLLAERGARVAYHDPHVPALPADSAAHPALLGMRSVPLDDDGLAGTDAAVICTDQRDVDYELLLRCCPLVVDTRNVYGRRGITDRRIVKA